MSIVESSQKLLESHDVSYEYIPGVPVVDGVSLSVARGSFSALIGPNGCGKSTLLRLLAGVLVPRNGAVLFDGKPTRSIERRRLATRIAYVPQSQANVFPFTALEVVLTGRSPYTSRFRFENEHDRSVALDALDAVGARHVATRPITELSGGERQLVSVARALAQEADCLLLDEPAASLDLKHRAQLFRVLRRLKEERRLTVLVVTHDLLLIDPSFDVLFGMRGGNLVAEGSPAEVLQEENLVQIYDDRHVRTHRVNGRTFVWSDW